MDVPVSLKRKEKSASRQEKSESSSATIYKLIRWLQETCHILQEFVRQNNTR
ncbi:hypothetical protein J1N35_040973, partial [Gossypium stocksii]